MNIDADGALAHQQRTPVVVEVGIVHSDGQGTQLDLGQPGLPPEVEKPSRLGQGMSKEAIPGGACRRVDAGRGTKFSTSWASEAAKLTSAKRK